MDVEFSASSFLFSMSSKRPYNMVFLGFCATASAFLVRVTVLDFLGNNDRFIAYYPAVALISLFGGLLPGLASTLFSLFLWLIWMIYFQHVSPFRPENIVSIGFFLTSCTLISVACGHRHKTRKDLISQTHELLTLRNSLEETVEIRTQELRTAQKSAQEETERLRVTLTSIGDGVITTDVEGRVILMNPVAEKLTGWTQDEAKGYPLHQVFRIVHEITRLPCPNPVDIVLTTRKVATLANHTLLLSKSGAEMLLDDSGAPIWNSVGKIIGVVLVFRDITEKLKIQDFLQRNDKLDSLGVLASGIAHDFNNLLSGLFGNLELIKINAGKPEKIERYLKKSLSVFDRAKSLTQQLRAFSKGGSPQSSVVSLEKLLRGTVSFALTGSNISHHLEFDANLSHCWCDEAQISQVVENLVINAKQAMPQGGSLFVHALNVDLDATRSPYLPNGKYVKVSVKDTGPGIVPEVLPRIFDPFFSTKKMGQGLGLAMVYTILRKHDGAVHVETEQGVGTEFTFYLPASELVNETSAAELTALPRGKWRVLVLDDEEMILENLREYLLPLGYDVVTCTSDTETLAQFRLAVEEKRKFQLIILDLTLPGGCGGKEIIGEIRKYDNRVRVIASSGYSDDEVMSDPTSFGFSGKLNKPYKTAELARVLMPGNDIG